MPKDISPSVMRALELLHEIESAHTELHAYLLDTHNGYDSLFHTCLYMEDSSEFRTYIRGLEKLLNG